MPWRRIGKVVVAVGPYAACGAVVWRMATWERAMTRWVAHGQRVFDAASGNIARAATELHEDAVSHGARQN